MKRKADSRRRGAVLIAVLVCMGIAVTILMGVVQSSLHHRRQLRNDLQLEQTRWLLDAGLSSALTKLREDPNYTGEAVAMGGALEKYGDASIEINVDRDASLDNQVRVHVTARLESVDGQPMKRSKAIVVNKPKQ